MIIAVNSHKGGTGKTTTAIHLADILSETGSVLLIDLDDSCNLTNFYIDTAQKKTIIEFLKGDKKTIKQIRSGLSIVCGSPEMARFDKLFYDAVGVELVLKEALDGLPFDNIIIDTPHSMGGIIANSLFAADVVVIPVLPHSWSVDGSMDIVAYIEKLKSSPRKKDMGECRPTLLPVALAFLSGHDRQLPSTLGMIHKGVEVLPQIPYNKSIMKHQSEKTVKKTNVFKAYKEVIKWLSK